MKGLLPLMIMFAGVLTPAYAWPPGGGWDGNNVKVSVTKSRLLTQETNPSFWGGGWDANNVKVSVVSSSKLLKEETPSFWGGGWDHNDAKVSVVHGSKLLK